MNKKIVIIFFLISVIFIFAGDSFALEPGDWFGFYDWEFPDNNPDNNTWTHENYNFIPQVEDSDPLIITHAWLILSIDFKPSYNSQIYNYSASIYLDNLTLGNIQYSSPFKKTVYNYRWFKSISDQDILNNIADRSATILIDTTSGTLKDVNHSVLLGTGKVGPEPISIALVGAGLVGLPIAVKFRRFLRK